MERNADPAAIRAVPEPTGHSGRGWVLAAVVIGVYVVLRLRGLTEFSLWGGETFLLDGIRMDWGPMMAYLAEDMVHPPLSYLLLRIWVAIGGESLLWLRLFPALAAIGTLVPLLLICRDLRLRMFETNLVLALAAVNGFLIHYAQEVRMYSLFLFFAAFSGWLFIRYFNAEGEARKELVQLFVVNLLLVYTHYMGWFVVGAQFLVLLIWYRRRLAWFTGSVGALGLAFLPWVLIVAQVYVRRGSTIGFIPEPSLTAVAYLYAGLNGPLTVWGSIRPGLLLFAVPIVWWFLRIVRRRTDPKERILFGFLAGFSFVPVAVAAVASRILPDSFFFDRYYIFVAPFYLLLVATAVYRLRPAALRWAYAGVLVVWSTAAGIDDLSTNRVAWISPQIGSRVHWEDAARELAIAPQLQERVNVYGLPVFSRGRMTGEWSIITSIPFHLAPAERERFEFVGLPNITYLAYAELESEFWAATFDLNEEGGNVPEERLRSRGFSVVERVRVGRPGQALLLVRFLEADSPVADSGASR